MEMSELAKTARRSLADNMGLILAVTAIIGSLLWMSTSLRNEMGSFRNEMDARFDAVDVRFNQVDARFEQVDARFEQVDARFNRIDARLDRVESHLERIDAQLYDLNGRLARVESGVFSNALPAHPETPPGDGAVPDPDPVADL